MFTDKNLLRIYIALARPCQNNVYRAYMYSLEIKSSTTITTTTTTTNNNNDNNNNNNNNNKWFIS